MAWSLVGFGCAVLASGILLLFHSSERKGGYRRLGRAGAAVGLFLGLLWASPASADHTEITTAHKYWTPTLSNGFKVFLSSPRHADSRSRGECGWEENINGRNWNRYAAADGASNAQSLFGSTYLASVSANARDNNYLANRTTSNNWGADVHLVTHSNAFQGCGNSAQYLLVMHRTGSSQSNALTDELIKRLNPVVPGGSNKWDCDGLAECNALAPHRAYVELFFHTNRSAVNWYQSGGQGHGAAWDNAWLYRLAIDTRLGYPRP
ncbi:hypothetical protein [Nonomuraea longicatena]|uniref:N-acetylmuramoyl-L-alanine amidase n=1 Tax=Nonomuraea longicatena TaxID=83682 RepID=A0ABN1QXC7_9ACTN